MDNNDYDNIIAGIAGGFRGSLILKILGLQEIFALNRSTQLVATGGTVVSLFLLHLISGNRDSADMV